MHRIIIESDNPNELIGILKQLGSAAPPVTPAPPKAAAPAPRKAAAPKRAAAPKKAAPKRAAPKKAAPKKAAPKKAAPKKAAPKKAAPKKVADAVVAAPKKAAPKKGAPKKAAPKRRKKRRRSSKPNVTARLRNELLALLTDAGNDGLTAQELIDRYNAGGKTFGGEARKIGALLRNAPDVRRDPKTSRWSLA